MVSLAGVVLGFLVKSGLGIRLAAPGAVLAGLLLGLHQRRRGCRVGRTAADRDAQHDVVLRGHCPGFHPGDSRFRFPDSFQFLGAGQVLGIPAQLIVVVLPLFVLLQFLLSRTVFGRRNRHDRGELRGGPVCRNTVVKVRFSLYALSGLLAGLAAVVMTSWLMAARLDVGNGLELQSITVVVLGGTSIFGGTGSLAGSMLAVLIVTLIASGLQLGNINTIWQLAVLGLILLAAVALNQAIWLCMRRRQGM